MQLLQTESANRFNAVLKLVIRLISIYLIFDSLLCSQAPPASAPRTAVHERVAHFQTNTDPGYQSSEELLEHLASEQIVRDTEFLGKTRFDLDRKEKTLFFDLTPAPGKFLLAKNDPYEPPLEALIRADVLLRDFHSVVPNDNFWVAPLESIQEAIKICIRNLDASKREKEKADAQELCSAGITSAFDKLQESILSFSSMQKLILSQPERNRDPAPGYRVEIKVDPPKARIRVMPLLEYKKNQYLKVPQDQYQWNDLLDSESELIGWYHYRAEWPAELNGPEEGDFCIKKPGLITFRPPQK